MTATTLPPGQPDRPLFLLTIDTEEEWDWGGPFPEPPFSTRNIDEIPAFQDFCRDLGVRPTYFVDHAVADDEKNAALLRDYFRRDECDIGAHLHPWCTPPLEEELGERNSHAVNLPLELVDRKIAALTERLVTAFGEHPLSYRAGRWGVTGEHLRILSRHGYRVDSSVRPFYADRDFSYVGARTRPYRPSFDDVLAENPDQDALLEVPTSSGYDRPAFERLDALHTKLSTPPLNRLRLVGILWRLRLLRKITVTPEGHDEADVRRCIDACIARGDRVVNMFFHSSDLLPGCTPYVRTEADKRRFMNCLRRCIEHVRDVHDARFVTMREIRASLTGEA